MITTAELETPTDRTALRPHSLAAGLPGLVLLHVERAYARMGDWQTVDESLRVMVEHPLTGHPDACSLFRGAPAVAYVIHTADRPGSQHALAQLDNHIIGVTKRRLQQAHQRIDRGELPALREYDLISGLTGIGVYLLSRFSGGQTLDDLLRYLVRLSQPVTVDDALLPGWWSASGPADEPSPEWHGGHGNLGLAHGVAGPLALLAIAHRRGIHVPGQLAAIERIGDWLDRWRCGPARRTWWPGLISRQELHTGIVRQAGPQRPSWCYGTPGQARAQQLAALALDDEARAGRAAESMLGCITDEQQLSQLTDPSLCHGWSGLIQAVRRAAADAGGDTQLLNHVRHLHARLADQLSEQGRPAEDGLLEGAAGVSLVHPPDSSPPASWWDACLLLDG